MRASANANANLKGQTAGDRMSLPVQQIKQPPRDWETFIPWFSVMRRIVSVARSEGHSVVTIRVIVNADGVPVQWAEPSAVRLEPKRDGVALTQLLENLTR